jgi:hypothetical protein
MSDEELGISYGGRFFPLGAVRADMLRDWARYREQLDAATNPAEIARAEFQLEQLFAELAREFRPPKPTPQLKPTRNRR